MRISSQQLDPVSAPVATQRARPAAAASRAVPPHSRRRGNLVLNMSIGQRLALGFLLAALIASLVAGLVGIQRSLLLSRQSAFYQRLLQTNTSLTTGANYLQLMNTETHSLLDIAASPAPSHETMSVDQQAIKGLAERYNSVLHSYVTQDLLMQHVDQVALLDQPDQAGLVQQQQTLAASSLRTWPLYEAAQQQILQDISSGNIAAAQRLIRFQGEPTNADALSALHSLIQFDQRLASSVQQQSASEERGEILLTIIGIVCAAVAIALVGWFISGTLVQRLRHLQQVTRAIEQGNLEARVTVIGRDEIADVSAAFNAMVEAILELLQESRRQRDVLTNAAEHLFSDMRVISSDELRTQATANTDPTGMLADAMNFAAGRLKRFRLRIQGVSQQLDVLARQLLERAEAYSGIVNAQQGPHATVAARTHQLSPTSDHGTGALKERRENWEQDIQEPLQALVAESEHLQELWADIPSQRLRQLLVRAQEATIASADHYGQRSGKATLSQRDYQALGTLLYDISTEMQNMQQSALQACNALDQDVKNLVQGLNTSRSGPLRATTPKSAAEGGEVARQGLAFAVEITALARQMTTVAQQLRQVAENF